MTAAITGPGSATRLSDGSTVTVRKISPDDRERLLAFHSQLSPESIYLRYFNSHSKLSAAEVENFTHVDGEGRMAFVVLNGPDGDGELIGVGRYDRVAADPTAAEVAFLVADAWHGRGVATDLLHRLADHARRRGYSHLVAETLYENRPMQDVFRHSGFPVRSRFDCGLVVFRMDITSGDAAAGAQGGAVG